MSLRTRKLLEGLKLSSLSNLFNISCKCLWQVYRFGRAVSPSSLDSYRGKRSALRSMQLEALDYRTWLSRFADSD